MPTPSDIDINRICTPVRVRGVTYTRNEIAQIGQGLRLLYLYSGPERLMDATVLAKVIGVDLHAVDILRDDTHDMADQHLWQDTFRSFQSKWYHGALMSPPCGSFSVARTDPTDRLAVSASAKQAIERLSSSLGEERVRGELWLGPCFLVSSAAARALGYSPGLGDRLLVGETTKAPRSRQASSS